MSHGGAAQPSCATVPLGKSVRRALRAAIGRPKRKDKPKPKKKKKNPPKDAPGVSVELSTSSLVAARREAVVRVVLRGGVVEVYPGVVLACTVIRNHPPGLCLAHPDVFRNPHGAVLRPLEPLFPGQKFLLVPESTVVRLKQKIPESSIGAFAADDDEDEDADAAGDEDSEEVTSSEGYSSGGAVSSSSEDERERGSSSSMPACSARDYYVARDRWSDCRFKKLVECGLAVEPSKEQEREEKTRKDGKKMKKRKAGKKKRRDRPVVPLPVGLRASATPRRTWEPSLPSVEEEESVHPPSESEEAITTDGHDP